MVCAAVAVPGLLRSSAGTVCTPAASLRLTASALRHLTLASIMKSKRKTDHLERTASVVRREVCIFGLWQAFLGWTVYTVMTGSWRRPQMSSIPLKDNPGKFVIFLFRTFRIGL